jgi:hypothetical protein
MAGDPDVLSNILKSVKAGLLIPESETIFDSALVLHINSAFTNLNNLGVGPDDGYAISTGSTESWSDLLGVVPESFMSLVKSYTILFVKTLFDPTGSSVIMTATKELLIQMEARINQQIELYSLREV